LDIKVKLAKPVLLVIIQSILESYRVRYVPI
jgi:hypothetical protein